MTVTEEIIAGLVCGLTGLILGHRLDLGRSRTLKLEEDIKAEKLVIIPLLTRFIEQSLYWPSPLAVRNDCIIKTKDLFLRFRIHLKGRHLAAVDKAWSELEAIATGEALCGSSNTAVYDVNNAAEAAELHTLQKILTAKLAALHDAISNT